MFSVLFSHSYEAYQPYYWPAIKSNPEISFPYNLSSQTCVPERQAALPPLTFLAWPPGLGSVHRVPMVHMCPVTILPGQTQDLPRPSGISPHGLWSELLFFWWNLMFQMLISLISCGSLVHQKILCTKLFCCTWCEWNISLSHKPFLWWNA